MKDDFSTFGRSLTAPATDAETIQPSDTDRLQHVTRAVYVGVGGDLSVEMVSGDRVLLANVQPGTLYPLRIVQVLATGTTATDLVGMR